MQEVINEFGKKQIRQVCAPCFGLPCIPLEVDYKHASRCKTQFVDEKGNIIGLCECFAHHAHGYDQPSVFIKRVSRISGVR